MHLNQEACHPMLLRNVFLWGTFVLLSPSMLMARENAHRRPVNQAALFAALDKADRLVMYEADAVNAQILYSSSNPTDIAEFKAAITLKPFGHPHDCLCVVPIIRLSRNGEDLATIYLHEDLLIATSLWSGFARITDQERWLHWFD